MIFFAACAANQGDLVAEEARKAGSEDVRQTSSGVEFEGNWETGMRFCLYSRVASRLLMALYIDEDTESDEELYESTLALPWEEWISPEKTMKITCTTQSCSWIRNNHYAALKVKDGICDRIKEKADGLRPDINTDNPDVGSIEADNRINIIPELYWYIDRWETGYNYYVETLQIGDWIDYKGPDGSGYNWYMLGDSECIAKETLYEGDIYFSTECYTHALKRPNLTLYNETGITEYFDSVIETEFKHPIPSLGFYKMDELGEVIKYVEMYTP